MGILLAIHVLVTIFLILVVLIQKTEGGSSLFANSGGGAMFNARGTSNILTKVTWVLSSIFLINCIVMATIASSNLREAQTLIDNPVEQKAPAVENEEKDKPAVDPMKESPKLDGKVAKSAQAVEKKVEHKKEAIPAKPASKKSTGKKAN